MSRAGQAGEVGSVFRCAVGVYLAVHGLRSRSISGLDLAGGSDPIRLDFETSDPTDDIRVTFSDGRRAYVSAKRKVTKGRPLEETVAGWVAQAASLGPDDLLVIAGEDFIGPARHLDLVLRRHRAGLRMETNDEQVAFKCVADLIPDRSRQLVLERARVLHLPNSTGASTTRDLLAALMDFAVADTQGQRAVSVLADLFHMQAGAALGSGIADWVAALNNAGVHVIADKQGPAGMRVASKLIAVNTYRERLRADAGRIDLSLLADDLSPVVVDDLVSGLKIDVDGARTSSGLLRYLRRWRRMLIVGQPGSGKSVAMREIAAHCASHPHAPIPIRVALPRLMKQQPERLTIDGIIDLAAADLVSAEHRSPMAEYLADAIANGRAIVLCDGLDECGPRAPWVAQQLANILVSLHPQAGFVLTTRANAQLPAARLGLPRVELAPPHDLSKTVDSVLIACADTRVAEPDREVWLATRRAWISEAKVQHDHLLSVPLLAILLTLICTSASDADLPKGRATLLHQAVEQSVHRWEQTRESLDPTRSWSPQLTTDMLLRGFIVLGRILDGGATPSRAKALEFLVAMLSDPSQWAMPPAQAHEVAEQVLRFWDEHVAVFVVNAADELTARSKVFAEIATAMWARDCERMQLIAWLSEALSYTDSDGAIALAAGLSPPTVGALLDLGDGGNRAATLMVAELATRGIMTLQPGEVERTLSQLATGVGASREGEAPVKRGRRERPSQFPTIWDRTRAPGPWPFVEAASLLALPADGRAQRADLIAEAELDDRSGMIAAALCELTDATTDGLPLGETGVPVVHAALAIPLPPKSETVQTSRRSFAVVGGGRLTPGLDHVALAAAGRLDELAEDSGELAFQIAMHASVGVSNSICAALARAGFDTSRRWSNLFAGMRNLTSAHKDYETALIADLTSLADSDLSAEDDDSWSLIAIGDLLAATDYQEVGTGEFASAFVHDSSKVRRSWLHALADAYGIDKSAVARQARYLQQIDNKTQTNTVSDDWYVASTPPLAKPSLVTDLDAALSAEHQQALLACLEADSDWIAWAAASVLIDLKTPTWDSQHLFDKDTSNWPFQRSGLLYAVAILTAGDESKSELARAAASDSSDYRYAARMAISVSSELDPDGSIMAALGHDPDMSALQA